jgi:hypothetical protein
MRKSTLLRTYPNGLCARITPRESGFLLELYDQQARRKPDLPVIVTSLEEAQRIADEHAGVPSTDPWMPVYPDTFNVALPEDSVSEQQSRGQKSASDLDGPKDR